MHPGSTTNTTRPKPTASAAAEGVVWSQTLGVEIALADTAEATSAADAG
jgi:hypothetical protein